MAKSRFFLLLGCAALILTACGEVREDLGMGRNPPDEFAVMERPPLAMPPDYGLHPPRPGALRPQNVDTTQQASDSVLGNSSTPSGSMSEGEKALLIAAGATKADPNIRETVDHEAAQKVVASPHLIDRLTHWGDDQKPSTTVDPTAEAERIKKAQQNNQPVTTGATPVIEKQTSGWLGL